MSPELKQALDTLEMKARTPIDVIELLREAGATAAADTLTKLVRQDNARKAEALAEAARVRTLVRK